MLMLQMKTDSGPLRGRLTAAVILTVHTTGLRKDVAKVDWPGEMDEREYSTKRESCSGNS